LKPKIVFTHFLEYFHYFHDVIIHLVFPDLVANSPKAARTGSSNPYAKRSPLAFSPLQ